MDQLLLDFKSEAKKLVADIMDILEDIEGDFSKKEQLKDAGLYVDRILGGAKSLELCMEDKEHVRNIANYAEICKLVSYRGASIDDNENFYSIVVGVLLDATEMLSEMILAINTPEEKDIKEYLNRTFLDRLKLVNQQFDDHTRGSLIIEEQQGPKKVNQDEIDNLMAALGM